MNDYRVIKTGIFLSPIEQKQFLEKTEYDAKFFKYLEDKYNLPRIDKQWEDDHRGYYTCFISEDSTYEIYYLYHLSDFMLAGKPI